MQRHLLVLRLDHVLDYVGARGVAPRVAKPLSGSVAFHHTGRVVVPAIPVEKQVKLNFSNSKTVFIIQVSSLEICKNWSDVGGQVGRSSRFSMGDQVIRVSSLIGRGDESVSTKI